MKHGVLAKPESFYPLFSRKPEGDAESTHYCAGCGHGNVHKLLAEALDDFGLRERTILISPVGCAVFGYYYFRCGNVQAAHGRAPAVATGMKRARPGAIVIAYQGDGDLAGIGGNEILHAANRGENITVVFVNNAIYGMTGGQMAPTTLIDQRTTTTPLGRDPRNEGYPIRVCELLATLEAPAYIERTSLHDTKHIAKTRAALRRAIRVQEENRGFSLVEILSPCPTGWGLSPLEARAWVEEHMIPAFPLGVFRDRREDPRPPTRVPPPAKEPGSIADALPAGGPPPAGTHRLIVAGFGGQGVLTLGALLASVGMRQGREVSWLPSYGPEMRGGTAHCHVVLSDCRVGSPLVSRPDILVAFNEPSVARFGPLVRPGGLVLYDGSFVTAPWVRADVTVLALSFARIANNLDAPRAVNMVALGALNQRLGLFPAELLESELRAFGKPDLFEPNRRAILAGAEAARAQER
jgi:2-oxoisovalerate ferredoxin oxidoreductase beta subunit